MRTFKNKPFFKLNFTNHDKGFLFSHKFFAGSLLFMSCDNTNTTKTTATEPSASKAPEYFNQRPKLEREYGYTHAVRIADDLKISGAVSMNDSGVIVVPGNMNSK